MAEIQRSRSYPEDLKDVAEREHKKEINILVDSLDKFREKDFQRTERLASLGSPSSKDIAVVDYKGCDKCCKVIVRFFNYILERGEEEQKRDAEIQEKSYAGFYFFLKWFIRSLVILIFTTAGNIAGKELGCLIKDSSKCSDNAFILAENSPHIVANIVGTILGLFTGQWLGRWIWDKSTENIQRCLRKCEKCADNSKLFLITVSGFVYLSGTVLFGVIFYFFVHITNDKNNIVGASVGGFIGLICAVIAYRKKSDCRSGQETPHIKPAKSSSHIPTFSLNS